MVERSAAERAATARTAATVARRLCDRNPVSRRFFAREAGRLALACEQMARRFQRGGRLLALGRGPYATDAQHVAVEFVHPVIVGKRALPALDLSPLRAEGLAALVGPHDMVMGFGPPGGDREILAALDAAATGGAMTFALPCPDGEGGRGRWAYAVEAATPHPLEHQETIEILYHTLWETVHVFLEHTESGHDVGAAAFLYPFLGSGDHDAPRLRDQVATSIVAKAADDERLREQTAAEQAEAIAAAVEAIAGRLAAGGSLLLFGNGGSATDANDWALDCVLATAGGRPIPALSLSAEPAPMSAIANDIGAEAIFLRQLIAHAHPGDVAIAISTSGGSANILAALEEARRRGLLTVALLGYDGGEAVRRGLADHALVVRCDYVPRIQEIQASIYHVMLEALAGGERVAVGTDAAAATGNGTELFGAGSCPFTRELRERLEWEGRSYVEHDVETDPAARARLERLLPGPVRVPVLVVDGRVEAVGANGRTCVVGAGAGCELGSSREPSG